MGISSGEVGPAAFAEGRKVLVVEDDELVRELATGQLETAGFEVVEARTGEDAVERFRAEAPDYLLTDINLPGALDGGDVAERCRAVQPELPIVYFTCDTFVEGRPMPGSRYVRKPYLSSQLVAAFAELAAADADLAPLA